MYFMKYMGTMYFVDLLSAFTLSCHIILQFLDLINTLTSFNSDSDHFWHLVQSTLSGYQATGLFLLPAYELRMCEWIEHSDLSWLVQCWTTYMGYHCHRYTNWFSGHVLWKYLQGMVRTSMSWSHACPSVETHFWAAQLVHRPGIFKLHEHVSHNSSCTSFTLLVLEWLTAKAATWLQNSLRMDQEYILAVDMDRHMPGSNPWWWRCWYKDETGHWLHVRCPSPWLTRHCFVFFQLETLITAVWFHLARRGHLWLQHKLVLLSSSSSTQPPWSTVVRQLKSFRCKAPIWNQQP